MNTTPQMKPADCGEQSADGYYGERMAAPGDSLATAAQLQALRLPAYGRDLAMARQAGYIVPYLILSLGWNFGRAVPRLVITDDVHIDDLDLHVVAGIDCMVTHHGQHVRAFDVAELALAHGATRCPVFDMATQCLTTTSEVLLTRKAAA